MAESANSAVGHFTLNNPGDNLLNGGGGNDVLEGRGGADMFDRRRLDFDFRELRVLAGAGVDAVNRCLTRASVGYIPQAVATGGDAEGDIRFWQLKVWSALVCTTI